LLGGWDEGAAGAFRGPEERPTTDLGVTKSGPVAGTPDAAAGSSCAPTSLQMNVATQGTFAGVSTAASALKITGAGVALLPLTDMSELASTMRVMSYFGK
jgi:hypothetical protein